MKTIYFPEIEKIQYEGKESKNLLAFRYYQPARVVYGRKMKDWFKFSMVCWHTLCADGGDPFGSGTKDYTWVAGGVSAVDAAKAKLYAGLLGSIDANRGDVQSGWDADQFPVDLYELTQALMMILRGGGFQGGGTNLGAKTRRNSTDMGGIFIAHIAGMDAFARALEAAAGILEESPYTSMLDACYGLFNDGKGAEFEASSLSLEDLVAYAKTKGEPKTISGKQELYEATINMYI